MNYYSNMFSNNSKLFLFFGIQLWILTGWLTPSAQGLECFYCQTVEVTKSSGGAVAGADAVDDSCVTPVKGTTPVETCPSGYPYCLRATSIKEATIEGEKVKAKLLRRTCAGGSGDPTETAICKAVDPKVNAIALGYALHPNKNLPQTKIKMGTAEEMTPVENSYNYQCICNTGDLCNNEPGLDSDPGFASAPGNASAPSAPGPPAPGPPAPPPP